jgi:hypothetical protein
MVLSTLLGSRPLLFDPSPADVGNGDAVTIGAIAYEFGDATPAGTCEVKVTYSIVPALQSQYDLTGAAFQVNGGALGSQVATGLAVDTFTQSITLALPLSSSQLDLSATATVSRPDLAALAATLPATGTVISGYPGNAFGAPSYLDSTVTPGLGSPATTLFDSWCIDIDRTLSTGFRYQAEFYSSYATDLPDTSADPKNLSAEGSSVAERIVERTENLDALNWALNQGFTSRLAAGRAVMATSTAADTVKLPWAYRWSATSPAMMKAQVATTGGGLTAGVDYSIRALNSEIVAFYATPADAENDVNRIDLTADLSGVLVRPYYTGDDVQRLVWTILENVASTGLGSPERGDELLAQVDAAVGLGNPAVTYTPGRGESVAVLIRPFAVDAQGVRVTNGQPLAVMIPQAISERQVPTSLTLNLGRVAGMKFQDRAGDGQKDAGDNGLGGWTIFVDYDGDSALGAFEPSAVTAADGSYAIAGVLPGTWEVLEVQQGGWVQTMAPAAVTIETSTNTNGVPASSFTGVDLGNFERFDLSGVKVLDNDRDGVAGGINDAGDARLAGIRIFLDEDGDTQLDWVDSATGANGVWDAGEGERWTATDATGAYRFVDLGPGTYKVAEDMTSLPGGAAGWRVSGAPAPISGQSGVDVTNANFYNYLETTTGGFVTYTLGGYGGNGQPGQFVINNYATAFPASSRLVVPRPAAGAASDIVLANATEVRAFLRATNSSRFTNANVSGYRPSTLEKQFVALSLSVRFDATFASFAPSTSQLGLRTFRNLTGSLAVANGLTISQVLTQARAFLDGSSAYTLGLSASGLNDLLSNVNEGFDNGSPTSWANTHLG